MKNKEKKFILTGLIGLGASFVGLFQSKKAKAEVHQPLQKIKDKTGKSGEELLLEDINNYLSAVFTHCLSLYRRRGVDKYPHEINKKVIEDTAGYVAAILDHYLKEFMITDVEIFPKHGVIKYKAAFLIPGTAKVWRKLPSEFMFRILGSLGDPVCVSYSYMKDEIEYGLGMEFPFPCKFKHLKKNCWLNKK